MSPRDCPRVQTSTNPKAGQRASEELEGRRSTHDEEARRRAIRHRAGARLRDVEAVRRRDRSAEPAARRKAALWKAAEDAVVAADAGALDRLLRAHEKMFRSEQPQSSWFGGLTPDYSKGGAREIIAREHFFESWDALAAFRKQLTIRRPPLRLRTRRRRRSCTEMPTALQALLERIRT